MRFPLMGRKKRASVSHLLLFLFTISWLSEFMEAQKKRIDPYAENELWESLKESRVQIPIEKTDKWEVNEPPSDDSSKYLKVVCISDTHDQLDKVDIPNGDVLLHAGDFTNNGNKDKIIEFNEQMGRLPHKYKLVVAGNHELGFDKNERFEERSEADTGMGTENGQSLLTNVTYLNDQEYIIDGVKFYGSSYHPLKGFPFYRTRAKELQECWKLIPNDTDVLITHTPPLGYMDLFNDERWGCKDLLYAVEQIRPRFHVFGHVHERHGAMKNNDTIFINAAQCTKNNAIQTRPVVFYIAKKL